MKDQCAVGFDIGAYETKITRLRQTETGEVEILVQESIPSPGSSPLSSLFQEDEAGIELACGADHTLRAQVNIGVPGRHTHRESTILSIRASSSSSARTLPLRTW